MFFHWRTGSDQFPKNEIYPRISDMLCGFTSKTKGRLILRETAPAAYFFQNTYLRPRTCGRISDTANPMAKFITAPIRTASATWPKTTPAITTPAEGVSPK